MDRIEITLGDFLKNAGIVGMKYLLEHGGAIEGEDYGMEPQFLWISRDYAFKELKEKLTDMYFEAFVYYMGQSTAYQTVLEKLKYYIDNEDNLKSEDTKKQKQRKKDLKFINDKLLANSYQSGFKNIENEIEKPEVYKKLQGKVTDEMEPDPDLKGKLTDKIDPEKLIKRMKELKEFLEQSLCKETFCMKSIMYSYINRFWGGKCFLSTQSKVKDEDMHKLFEEDFSKPFISYLENDHTKNKDLCIDCNMPMGTKEKVSITFMNDVADDLTRKKSAFWNYKVDAYLCPCCALIYALVPLGFQLAGNKFIFINTNESVKMLLSSNKKAGKIQEESKKKENETYTLWFARLMNLVLNEKVKELTNVQVILKGKEEKDQYIFSILHKDILTILKDNTIQKYLSRLATCRSVKEGSSSLSLYEMAVMNILKYQNQYTLINRMLKLSIENEDTLFGASSLYELQIRVNDIKNYKFENEEDNEGGKRIMETTRTMRKNGFVLRTELLKKNGADLSDDSCLRGRLYQLINALSVGNKYKFMEIVLRLYCSCQKSIPSEFVLLLEEQENFLNNGYAFVLGLKGSYKNKETVENRTEDND